MVEGRSQSGDRHLERERELRCSVLELALGLLQGQADLASHLLHSDRRELGEQQRLALGGGEIPQGLDDRGRLRVGRALAVEEPRARAALGEPPRVRPYHRLGVVHPLELAPVVCGDDEGLLHGSARGLAVAGQREGLHEEAVAGVAVERIEPGGIPHRTSCTLVR